MAPLLLPVLLSLILAAGSDAPGPRAEPSLDARVQRLLDRSSEMRRAGHSDSVLAQTDELLAECRARPDSALVVVLQTHRARHLMRTARPREGEPDAREAVAIAEALGDSHLLLEPVFVLAQVIDAQGRPPRVVPWLHRLIALGRAAGDSLYEARGRLFLARRTLAEGNVEAAVEDLRFVTAGLARHPADLTGAQLLLGLAHARLGQWEQARSVWQECGRLSREIGNAFMEASALTNLGMLEETLGDPAEAASALRRAHAIYLREGNLRAAVIPGTGSASHLARLGDFDAALALLEETLALVREQGFVDLEPHVLQVLGSVHERQGARGAARRAFGLGLDRAFALGDAERVGALAPRLARILIERDSSAVALELMQRVVQPLESRMAAQTRLAMQPEIAQLLLHNGAPHRALARADSAAAEAAELGLRASHLNLLRVAAEAALAAGRNDVARARIDAAIDAWESMRLVTSDPRWRESMGEAGPLLGQTDARITLAARGPGPDAAAIEALWSRLQRLRTRTLLERMRGPASEHPALPTTLDLADVRAAGFLAGAPLIEVVWGPEEFLLFWIDDQRCELRTLSGSAEWQRRVHQLQRLLAMPSPQTGTVALETARALGAELLGPWIERLGRSEQVLYAPEGPLFGLPLELLANAPRLAVQRVPSAALLMESPRVEVPFDGTMLAVAGDRNEGGEALAGARREIDRLVRRYGARRYEGAQVPLAPASLLHVAAHTRIDDQSPWRSAILLDAGEPGQPTRWWAASDISEGETVARVAVLSGCASAGGRALGGEGMLGIAHAFLSSGTSAVVATLWPVDDGIAADFGRSFYEQLSRGATVTQAVATTKARLRAEPRSTHPAHWAPWVVIGREDVTIELQARRRSPLPAALLGLAALGLLGWAAFPSRLSTGKRMS